MILDTSVRDLIDGVTSATRRRDAITLVGLFEGVTGVAPALWPGKIIGFGSYDYRYESGREGTAPAAAFSPRAAAISVYLPDGTGAHSEALPRLGPHRAAVGCLYLGNLDRVDLDVLTEVISSSYRRVTEATFGSRARDSQPDLPR